MPSTTVSASRNTRSPTVKARKNPSHLFDARLRAGNHSSPTATGITPTYTPRSA
jgi:hypothetical protein